MPKELNEAIKKIKMLVETDKNFGIEEYFLSAEQDTINSDSQTKEKKQEELDSLEQEALQCKKCPLYKTRTHLVFGEGSPDAELMFVGEAPGRDEDLHGKPFIGRAGKLLTKIINAMNLKREDVYIANILKDRPPNNRNPKDSEIESCIEYLRKQIKIIEPKVICALGSFAAKELLNEESSISKLRGKFYDYEGIKFMPTYHPAYLLRNSHGKKFVWEDMKKIMKELNIKNKHDS